jgi:hypothetical protein
VVAVRYAKEMCGLEPMPIDDRVVPLQVKSPAGCQGIWPVFTRKGRSLTVQTRNRWPVLTEFSASVRNHMTWV